GDPLLAQVGPTTIADLLAATGSMFPNGRRVEIRTRTVPALTPGVIEALVSGASAMTSPLSAIAMHSLHGAAARVASEDMAFAARTPHLVVENVAIWESGDDAPHRAWARDLSTALAAEALPGGYVNLLGPDDTDQIAHVYGANRDRLLAAKHRFDPDGVFSATPLPW
ncbi:MAG: BBE domain-containing protein, partial [Pseudonocardia sp.]